MRVRKDELFGNRVKPADLMVRPKQSGNGFHYGTGVSGNLVAHKTPERGKQRVTPEEFCAGLPCWGIRFDRTPNQAAVVEQVALSDLGGAWQPWANCEHDVTRAQFGVAYSPTANGVIACIAITALAMGVALSTSDN